MQKKKNTKKRKLTHRQIVEDVLNEEKAKEQFFLEQAENEKQNKETGFNCREI